MKIEKKRREKDAARLDPKSLSLRERAETGCIFEDEYPEGSDYLAWLRGEDQASDKASNSPLGGDPEDLR